MRGGERERVSFFLRSSPSLSVSPAPLYLLDVGLRKGGLVAQQAVLRQLIPQLLVDGEEGLSGKRGEERSVSGGGILAARVESIGASVFLTHALPRPCGRALRLFQPTRPMYSSLVTCFRVEDRPPPPPPPKPQPLSLKTHSHLAGVSAGGRRGHGRRGHGRHERAEVEGCGGDGRLGLGQQVGGRGGAGGGGGQGEEAPGERGAHEASAERGEGGRGRAGLTHSFRKPAPSRLPLLLPAATTTK